MLIFAEKGKILTT